MSLIYLTGLSGTGKSAVCNELLKRSYEVYEVDHRPKEKGTRLDRAWIESLATQAKDKVIFLSGVRPRHEEKAVADLFSKVILLTADRETLKYRLTTRTNNDYGKDSSEMEKILDWAEEANAYHKRVGTTMIDSTKSLDEVVNQVIKAAT